MKTIRDRVFGAHRVSVDGINFVECTFNGTTLVFSGGVWVGIQGGTPPLEGLSA